VIDDLNALIERLTDIRRQLATDHGTTEEAAGNTVVRVAYQPNYPLACDLSEVTAVQQPDVGDSPCYVLYLAAGGDGGYAPRAAWDGDVVTLEHQDEEA
jgi:hypothetical protein